MLMRKQEHSIDGKRIKLENVFLKYFKVNFLLSFSYMYVYLCMWAYKLELWYLQQPDASNPLELGVPDVGTWS